MKHLKKAALIALLITAPYLWAQKPPTDSLALQGRIGNLELMRDNLSRELELHKQDLAQQVTKLENESILLFSISSIIAAFGTITILISFWKGVAKAKEKLLLEAEGIIESEVKSRLPKLTQETMQAAIHLEMAPLMKLIQEQKTKERILSEANVVLWAEDDIRGEKALHDFLGVGFKRVSIGTPSETTMPNADLLVFVRQEPFPDNGWKIVTDGFVKKILDMQKGADGVAFFYYGPHNDSLKPKMYPCLALANYQHTIVDRAYPLLSKRFAA